MFQWINLKSAKLFNYQEIFIKYSQMYSAFFFGSGVNVLGKLGFS